MERTQRVFGHLAAGGGSRLLPRDTASVSHFQDAADDVVIVQALRTPICKARRGGFKDTYPDDMLSTVFTALMNDVGISPGQLEDICVGNVNQQGSGAAMARVAQFYSDIPYSVPLSTVNRQCASGLQAVANIAGGIKTGSIDIGIGAGVETLTFNPMGKKTGDMDMNLNRMMTHDLARDVIIPMGITSENVAEQFGITREQQDHMALISNQKAAAAQKNGWFDAEIVPVRTILKDKDGVEREVVISKDDGVRPGTNMEGLAKLKPAFKPGGCTTAGNASQISDGAAAVLLARRSYAKEHNLPILGVFRLISVVGVPPNIMGVGPAYAIPAVLKKAGMTIDDIDIFEINEAFASQAVYCVEKLGIPMEKVNPKGGAIALGHPLGCTGARMVGTLLHELKRRGGKGYGIVSMCQGTGMGSAAIIEFPG